MGASAGDVLQHQTISKQIQQPQVNASDNLQLLINQQILKSQMRGGNSARDTVDAESLMDFLDLE